MIAALSDVLRSLMARSSRPEVPLAEEVQLLWQYLEIQKARFAEWLQIELDIPNELLPSLVPSLLLQLIVENAIRHGIAKRAFGGAVEISASRLNGSVTINVYNNGPTLPDTGKTTPRGSVCRISASGYEAFTARATSSRYKAARTAVDSPTHLYAVQEPGRRCGMHRAHERAARGRAGDTSRSCRATAARMW
jgi:LytS/YehU family sensor histidine kinase